MKIVQRHSWDISPAEAIAIQQQLRSRPGVKPLYISIGHRVSLATALDYVMACVTRYRLPETTRWAHRLASGPAVECNGGR